MAAKLRGQPVVRAQMKYTERRQWLYDAAFGALKETQLALQIHAEYIKAHAPKPPNQVPKFFEIDRRITQVDQLWHMPLDERTVFTREIEIPALIFKERPDWRLTKIGLTPQQKHKVWLGNLHLQQVDWFPQRGDLMFYEGYRHMIINVVLEPNAYWAQTNVWLGLICETIIPAEGDARPVIDPSVAVPAERLQTNPVPGNPRPLPEP